MTFPLRRAFGSMLLLAVFGGATRPAAAQDVPAPRDRVADLLASAAAEGVEVGV